ncbi:uncharacterized protein Tco025E_05638 [Trypanosoma conorhini]|uniref:F-box domain-containing protein n=1 Tax=Trypanosoma conorhini TaxID=83891 RepID=A0A3R7P0K6_9TRYP|nr:uncharacterized protein Tco025E_05638 [Trypanosoma conorhini]RNF15189.1 hypothetical protein Tco025E_05638 [Trypanosoma conorhini]
MGGVSTPSSTDGGGGCGVAAPAAEASATDGNQGGRCVCRRRSECGAGEREAAAPVVCRTSRFLAQHPAGHDCGMPGVSHGEAGRWCHAATPPHACQCDVARLPTSVLDVVFTFLQAEDLRTVLGVSQSFYRAASESDRTAWKAACFSLWRGKQGLGGVAEMWAAAEEACRREELEVISLQQQMLMGAHTSDTTTAAAAATQEWMRLQGGETDSEAGEKPTRERAHHDPPPPPPPPPTPPPPCWTGCAGKSESASIATTASDGDSVATGARGAPQQLWGRASLRSTPTYDAIMNTTNSPHLRASLVSPVRRGVSLVERPADTTAAHAERLYWWQLTPEQRQQQLYRMQQDSQRRRLRAQQRQHLQLLDEEGAEANTTTTTTTTTSRTLTGEPVASPRRRRLRTGSLGPPLSHSAGSSTSDPSLPLSLPSACAAAGADQLSPRPPAEKEATEDAGDSADDLDDTDADTEATGRRDGDPYEEFAEEMALTHSLSLLQHAQQKALRRAAAVGSSRQGGGAVDDAEEEAMQLPVSWKFAYHMSLRDARRQWVTKQELIESTWYVCFRATGKTHPATFATNGTLIIHPAVHALAGTGAAARAGGAAMPPLLYHLLKGGSELVVHNFPPLKVHRRLALASDAAANNVGDSPGGAADATAVPLRPAIAGTHATNQEAAERAFLAEPGATLRRLMAKGEKDTPAEGGTAGDAEVPAVAGPAKDDAPTADWGWGMQNFFVKIFSTGTPVPLYIHRLRRTCAPRPP